MPFQKGNPGRPRTPFETRLWAKIIKGGPGECWEWVGYKSWDGYGAIRLPGIEGMVRAHRATFELIRGPIPAGLQLDHLCRNRACVNPVHLDPVTGAENRRRGILRGNVKSQPWQRPRKAA